MFYYYYDWTYILVLIGVVLSLLASAKVKSTFARYSNVRSYSGMTGRDAAEKILHAARSCAPGRRDDMALCMAVK